MQEFDDTTGTLWGVRRFPSSHEGIRAAMRRVNPIDHPSVMLRRAAPSRRAAYLDLPYLEDYDLWTRMMSRGAHLGNLDEPLVMFRGGSASLRRRRAKGVTRAEWRLQGNLVSYGIVSRLESWYNCRRALTLPAPAVSPDAACLPPAVSP